MSGRSSSYRFPQPHPSLIAISELDAGGLEGGADGRQVVRRWHSAPFLEVPDGAFAKIGTRAEFGLRPVQQSSGGTGLGRGDRHRKSFITHDYR
jgi:hypothetical protein